MTVSFSELKCFMGQRICVCQTDKQTLFEAILLLFCELSCSNTVIGAFVCILNEMSLERN